jgi:hypothetical protein
MTTGQIADALKDIADQLSTNGDRWDYQADRLYKIAKELIEADIPRVSPRCPICRNDMAWSRVSLGADAFEWQCVTITCASHRAPSQPTERRR